MWQKIVVIVFLIARSALTEEAVIDSGVQCGIGENATECRGCETKPCYPGVSCIPTDVDPFYTCSGCPSGYTGDGVKCEDINECETEDKGKCGSNSQCVNTEGSYKCQTTKVLCPDEKNECNKNAFCYFTGDRNFTCKCKIGSAGNGFFCGTDIDLDGWPDNELECKDTRCKKDNCQYTPNSGQEDADGDGIGDACDSDADNDEILKDLDNCPLVSNLDQKDSDLDQHGDACDNCLTVPNFDQSDIDADGLGDACDPDIDNDGINNDIDNCPFIYNPDQEDHSENGVGDACDAETDSDTIVYPHSTCSSNLKYTANFTKYHSVALGPEEDSQIKPSWVIYDKGAEILQKANSGPGLIVGYSNLQDVDFEGTFFVDTDLDGDYIGFIFSYQSNKRFYTVMWKRNTQTYWDAIPFRAVAESAIQLKLVNSTTGPGKLLRNALWHTGDSVNQVKLLWKDTNNIGWKPKTSYRWMLLHRPQIGLIRFRLYDGKHIIADSGNIFDTTLKGGRLGVLSFSQEMVIWYNLTYRCNNKILLPIYKELPKELQNQIEIDEDVPIYSNEATTD